MKFKNNNDGQQPNIIRAMIISSFIYAGLLYLAGALENKFLYIVLGPSVQDPHHYMIWCDLAISSCQTQFTNVIDTIVFASMWIILYKIFRFLENRRIHTWRSSN